MLRRLPAAAAMLALTACAAPPKAPGDHGDPAAPSLEFDLRAALPAGVESGEPLMASRIGIGSNEDFFSYDASYAMEPGAVFAQTAAPPGVSAAQHLAAQALASQRIGQALALRLPTPAGEPLALQLHAELQEQWKSDGGSVARQRQVARLGWSPGPASLQLQWNGGAVDKDPGLALGCSLHGRLEIPLQVGSAGSVPALGVYGRDCQVLAGDADYGELAATRWGAALRWEGRDRETRLSASLIDPRWEAPSRQDIGPGYELGMSHRHAYGAWSAEALLAMRYTSGWEPLVATLREDGRIRDGERYWTAGVALTRQLPAVSVTARWSHGADPAWFMPVVGMRTHRVDMRLDFSRLVAGLLPRGQPQLAMEWHWSQARSRSNEMTGQESVRLDMGVGW